jgi:DNA topoisomerase IA
VGKCFLVVIFIIGAFYFGSFWFLFIFIIYIYILIFLFLNFLNLAALFPRAENLILASDPDREGEAIAWHIIEMLQQQDSLREDQCIARVVFHEITEASIKSALQSPREIDANLVHAYLARRALDYLIGFNISPLLWRKLPGCQSAGRVQSAALSLICDREMEIDEFKPQEYWSIELQMNKNGPGSLVNDFSFPAQLSHYDSKKLNQLSISSFTEAKDIEEKINSAKFQVVSSIRSKMRKNPPTPYITSTLQQDAANKLHFTAAYIMKVWENSLYLLHFHTAYLYIKYSLLYFSNYYTCITNYLCFSYFNFILEYNLISI